MTTRTVLLLGRRPSVRWADLRAVLRKDDELVLLSLGYPVTSLQREALFEAKGLAERAGAWFDAVFLTSTNEMLTLLQPDDDVHLAASGFEKRRLRRALSLLVH